MKTFSKCFGAPVLLSVLALTSGCGEDANANANAQKYPFTTEDGDTFCSADRGDGAAEFYHFDKMTEMLLASEELRVAADLRGVQVVDSCEAARLVNELHIEELKAEMDEAPVLTEEDADVPVEKIYEGTVRVGRWVVEILVNGSRCSGSIIHSRHLLTAAHCFTSAASQMVTVNGWDSNGVQFQIASGMMQVMKQSGFVEGVKCHPADIAVVRSPTNWGYPAQPKAFFGRQLFNGATPELWGYGANNGNGTGGGFLRRTNGRPTVSSSTHTMMGFQAAPAVGRPCQGDSGGPAMTVTTETQTVAGVASCFEGPSSCPGNTKWYWYRQVGPLAQTFVVNTVHQTHAGACVNKAVGDYNYWKCF